MMRATILRIHFGQRRMAVATWHAALLATVIIGMPWLFGMILIVRAAIYGL